MGVHRGLRMESVASQEILIGADGKRRWPDEVKGHLVAETLVPGVVQSHLQKKPFDGAVYVFRAKRANRLKMIWWDGTGLVMEYIGQCLLCESCGVTSPNQPSDA